MGKSFDRIIKVPLFAISSENVGIQLADMAGHIIGRREIGDEKTVDEFWKRLKQIEYKSKAEISKDRGKKYYLFGFKVARRQGRDV